MSSAFPSGRLENGRAGYTAVQPIFEPFNPSDGFEAIQVLFESVLNIYMYICTSLDMVCVFPQSPQCVCPDSQEAVPR